MKSNLVVFYAWQDDLPKKFNRYAIKWCLESACAEISATMSIELDTSVTILVDEATRDIPGSPHIPSEILKKIQAADIFVADVSAINSAQYQEAKKTPNPNVVFELGTAVAHLGWERVLLLVNEAHASVTDLPFDFDRQRATPFKFAENGVGSKQELKKKLEAAISLIINKDPKKPKDSQFDVDEANRARDLTTIIRLLGSIHWPTIDHHIDESPKYLDQTCVDFLQEVEAIVSSSYFHLYDGEVNGAVNEFVGRWKNSMSSVHYTPSANDRLYVFTRGSFSDREEEDKNLDYMEHEKQNLRKARDFFLSLIRRKFPEINIQAESQAAAVRYNKEMEELKKRFERPH